MLSSLLLSSSVIAPHALVVAAGIDALVPSDDTTVKEVPFAVADKFVVTLDTLALLVAILLSIVSKSTACVTVIWPSLVFSALVANLFVVDASLISSASKTTAPVCPFTLSTGTVGIVGLFCINASLAVFVSNQLACTFTSAPVAIPDNLVFSASVKAFVFALLS